MTDDTTIALPEGRSLAITPQDRALRITDPDGLVELEIELRPTGSIVRVRAAALQIATEGELSVDCERFELRAREGVRVSTDGDLRASVTGDLDLRATGHAHYEGKAVRVRATRGEVQLEAHDDVRVEGEQILLNS